MYKPGYVDLIRWVNWDNYESMLLQEGKSRNVIDEHRLVIDRALDLAGDPKTVWATWKGRHGVMFSRAKP